MLEVYLNYPNSSVTVHGDMACGNIRSMGKAGQRRVNIDRSEIENELRRFRREHKFASTAEKNDMWVSIDARSLTQEERILERIVETLRERYTPFRRAVVDWHGP